MSQSRRTFILGATGLVFAKPALAAAVLTPRQTAGPFYPARKPEDQDMDLTVIAGRSQRAQGEAIEIAGRVFKASGEPVKRGVVEIWQANAFGRYAHPGDRGGAETDPNFEGYGLVETGADGAYRFRTIKPAAYGSRTPHIHFRVLDASGTDLVTQMYFPGEALNARDGLYRRLASNAARTAATAQPNGAGRYTWDIIVA